MTQSELKARLRAGKLGGVYLFSGEEDYLKRHYVRELRSRILTEPAFEPFNHVRGEGASIDFGLLLDAVKVPPMMAEYKLIEWDGADFEAMREAELESYDALVSLVSEHPYVALVLRASASALNIGTPKRPSALYRRLCERSDTVCAVHFDAPSDSQLLSWLSSHFAHEGLSVTADGGRAMLDRVGHNMDLLAAETDKLVCYCRVHREMNVTAELVRQICCSTAEDDAFGLSNAILAGDVRGAYRRLHDLRRRRVDPMLILAQLSRLFSDLSSVSLLLAEGGTPQTIAAALSMNEYKAGLYMKGARARSGAALTRALALCREADLAAKSGVDPSPRLDRLIAELV